MGQENRFISAAIPRAMRQKRLWYFGLRSVIGSIEANTSYHGPTYFDVMMFTPTQYERARTYLSTQNPGMPGLDRGGDNFVYIPQHVYAVEVPANEQHPEQYAKAYFREVWNLKTGAAN